jgi:hypothetical protein
MPLGVIPVGMARQDDLDVTQPVSELLDVRPDDRHHLLGARVDPELDTIRVYRRSGEHYARPAEPALEQGDTLAAPLLPGLQMPLAAIFRD